MERDQFRSIEGLVAAMTHSTMEQEDRIHSNLGMTRASLRRDVLIIRAWLNMQPHLPAHEVDDLTLERMLVRCKNSVVAVQRRIDSSLTIRSLLPEFFANRDPLGPDVQQVQRVIGIAVIPKLSPDLQRVSLIRLLKADVSQFNLEHILKTIFMSMDIVLREPATMGDVLIWDGKNFSIAHALCVSPMLVRRAVLCAARTYPARVSAVHILQAPPVADSIINLVKKIIPEKVANRIHLHSSLESLHEHVPKNMLPMEYGGTQGFSVNKLHDIWTQKLVSYRPWFLHSEKVKINEKLRKGLSKTPVDVGEIQGSFRKLNID